MIHRIKSMDGAINPFNCRYGSGIFDANRKEIFDGDILEIDFDGAKKIVGDGFLIQELLASKPTPDAILVVEFSFARFRLVWRVKNGSVDCKDIVDGLPIKETVHHTGADLYTIDFICPYVEVVGSMPWKN